MNRFTSELKETNGEVHWRQHLINTRTFHIHVHMVSVLVGYSEFSMPGLASTALSISEVSGTSRFRHPNHRLINGHFLINAFRKPSFRKAYTNGFTHELAYDKVCANILKTKRVSDFGKLTSNVIHIVITWIGSQHAANKRTTMATIRVTRRFRRSWLLLFKGWLAPFCFWNKRKRLVYCVSTIDFNRNSSHNKL